MHILPWLYGGPAIMGVGPSVPRCGLGFVWLTMKLNPKPAPRCNTPWKAATTWPWHHVFFIRSLLVAASRISSAMAQTVFASMAKLGAPKCCAVLELLKSCEAARATIRGKKTLFNRKKEWPRVSAALNSAGTRPVLYQHYSVTPSH